MHLQWSQTTDFTNLPGCLFPNDKNSKRNLFLEFLFSSPIYRTDKVNTPYFFFLSGGSLLHIMMMMLLGTYL